MSEVTPFARIASMSGALKESSQLPLRLRLAWGTSVWERVLGLYSPYFRQKYHQDELLDYLWSFALGGRADPGRQDDLMERIDSLKDELEEEGYATELLYVGDHLIGEIVAARGSLVAGLEYAGFAYALHQLYRQGISGSDPAVPTSYIDALQIPYYEFALKTLDAAKSWGVRPPERGMFDSIVLDTSFKPLDPADLQPSRGNRPKPPVHEILSGSHGP